MATYNVDPGGGAKNKFSYAKSVKSAKFEPLNRNILEIVLEKKLANKNVSINGEEVA